MNVKRFIFISLFCFGVWCGPPPVVFSQSSSEVKFMSLAELEKLLKSGPVFGHFESVPKGFEIKKYQIKIEGIASQPGLKAIVFTSKHQIAAGMSGAPAYVKGKLIGAVAYRLNNFTKIGWGGIAPIGLMEEDKRSASLLKNNEEFEHRSPGLSYRGMLFNPISLGSEIFSLPDQSLSNFGSVFGLEQKLISLEGISSFGQSKTKKFKNALKAGMPIMVDLVEWNNQQNETNIVSALGTITYINPQSGEIYAFGHPFLDAKNVFYTFRTCEIMVTVFSELNSFKICGQTSEILGVMKFDSVYGVFGEVSLKELPKLRNINLELKREGKTYNKFKIRLANSKSAAASLISIALAVIGQTNNAPFSAESSMTELAYQLELKSYPALVGRKLSISQSFNFFGRLIHVSSYDTAVRNFIAEVYMPILLSTYNLNVLDMNLTANFMRGKPQEVKLVAYKFPNKVVWGEDPIFEILLVSEDNAIALERKLKVKIGWDTVEVPIYTKETKNTEKDSEKIVRGFLNIASYNLSVLASLLSDEELELLQPDYFLGPEDFLKFFSETLQISDQKIFARISLGARSGFFDEKMEKSETVVSPSLEEGEDWHIVRGGVKSRHSTLKNEGVVKFLINFPLVPNNYLIDPNLHETFSFEVVKKIN